MSQKIKIGIDERTGLFVLQNSAGDPISRPLPKSKIENFLDEVEQKQSSSSNPKEN